MFKVTLPGGEIFFIEGSDYKFDGELIKIIQDNSVVALVNFSHIASIEQLKESPK